jgi:hypothetical protein
MLLTLTTAAGKQRNLKYLADPYWGRRFIKIQSIVPMTDEQDPDVCCTVCSTGAVDYQSKMNMMANCIKTTSTEEKRLMQRVNHRSWVFSILLLSSFF